jgi:hypothetical protein
MSLSRKWKRLLLAGGVMAVPVTLGLTLTQQNRVQGSDHADTAENMARPGADLSDLYIFPSPRNTNNVVFVLNCHPLLAPGTAGRVSFDPDVLYQFKIDNTGDGVEDLVMQAKFEGVGPTQRVRISGPVKPSLTGTSSRVEAALPTVGRINSIFQPTAGMTVFAGAREDPFFLDLDRLFQIFPDRQTPLLPPRRNNDINTPDPNRPRVNGFRPKGEARDFFRNLNLLSIVIELPKAKLGTGNIGVWMTTSVPSNLIPR